MKEYYIIIYNNLNNRGTWYYEFKLYSLSKVVGCPARGRDLGLSFW